MKQTKKFPRLFIKCPQCGHEFEVGQAGQVIYIKDKVV